MSPPIGQQLCGTVPEQLAHRIRARADEAQRSLSSEVADLLQRGVDASEEPRYQLVDELQQLRRTTATLGRLGGVMSTATGCWWAESIEAMPRPELLDPCDLIALPSGLLLIGGDASLAVDLEAERILAIDPAAGEVSAAIEVPALLGAAANALPAMVRLAHNDGPGLMELGIGLAVERLPNDRLRVTLNGVGPVVEASLGWKWAVEIGALACRGVNLSVNRRLALEQQLQGVKG